MKARWLIITVLLAFPFALAFFLSEARLGDKRAARPALVVPPPIVSLSAKPATTASATASPLSPHPQTPEYPAEEIMELAGGGLKAPSKPVLFSGTFTREDNSLIYDADARLRLASDAILSSPTGVMVSNEKQTIFAGDMQIEAGKNTITAHEGVIDTTTNQMKATVASIAFTNDKNQLIRMTGENVTLELPSDNQPTTGRKVTGQSMQLTFPPISQPPAAENSESQ